MKILRDLEMLAVFMLIVAVVCLLGGKLVEHVAGMVAPHTHTFESARSEP